MRGATRRAVVLAREERSGGLLVLALACWLLVANLVSGGSWIPPVALVVGATLAYVLGRLLGRWHPFAPHATVGLLVLVLFAWTWPEVVSREPLAGPLGYQNANAALAVQAFVGASAIVAARDAASAGLRVAAALAALLFVSVPILVGAYAAAAGAMLVLIVAAWVTLRPTRSIAPILSGGFLVVVTATVIAGAVYAGTNRSAEPAGEVSARLVLWADAVRIVAAHPLAGTGSGTFAEESPTARADPDRRYAHEEFLQTAAETGVVGGVLAVALFVWASAWTAARDTPQAAIVAAGVTALGINACMDYVLHFPIVPIACAVLVGGALAHHPGNVDAENTRGEEQGAR